MSMVIYSNTIVDPWTMAANISLVFKKSRQEASLVMLCNASIASPAMFTSQRHSHHASDTEVLVIILPQA